MTIDELARLTHQVLWASFFVAMAFGAIVQRTSFCTMGAIADVVTMGDWTRIRQWALAAGVAVAGFGLLAWAGLVNPEQTLYASRRWIWLSALVGGGIFGFGMVLSSGCASKALVRAGAGNLKAWVVVLVVGVSGFATLKGITAVLRTQTVDRVALESAVDASLPAWAASAGWLSPAAASLVLALAVGAGLLAFALWPREARRANSLLAGAGIGACIVAMWWITGHFGHVTEHPLTLQETYLATNSGRAEAMSFIAPIAYALDWLMFFSDANKLLTVGIVTVAGVLAGSLVMALAQRSFRWEGFGNVSDVAHHLAGGTLMGVGGVTAMGCSIGQGISGLSTLSATSIVALAAMIAGAVGGVKYQEWQLGRTA